MKKNPTLKKKTGLSIINGLATLSLLTCSLRVYADTFPIYENMVDRGRTGANLHETILNTQNVHAASFGLLFSLPVDGQIYAQPLYVPNVVINKRSVHNVVYVATMNDTLYAFDADTPGPALWSKNFVKSPNTVETAVNIIPTGDNIQGTIGIESTPVIDPSTNTLYLVTRTDLNTKSSFQLHAIDIGTGAEKFGGPTELSGTFNVLSKTFTFNPQIQNQRAGLALAKGQIIISFASHEDRYFYFGWVLAYDAKTLKQTATFMPTPLTARGGGIWQSGRAPAVDDDGNIYLFVGNAFVFSNKPASSTYDGINNFSESVLKLDPANKLKVLDWYTPSNYVTLDQADKDLGSSGPLLIPGTHLLTGGGKDGNFLLLDQTNLGKMLAGDTQVLQTLPKNGSIHGGPVFWQRDNAEHQSVLYSQGPSQGLKAYTFNGSLFTSTTPFFTSANKTIAPNPGGFLTLSANGDEAGTGIVWSTGPAGPNGAEHQTTQGLLRSFNAETGAELWNSSTYLSDNLLNFAKFTPPIVSNGKVYASTFSNLLQVYGLFSELNNTPPALRAINPQISVASKNTVFAISATDVNNDILAYNFDGLPNGLTANSQTGVITGTPTVPGNFSVTVSVTDNKSAPRITNFTWHILASH